MTLFPYIDDILVAFVSSDYMTFWFFPFIALAFLATFPAIVRSLFSWR